jgi:hypothetical protein
MMVVLGNEKMQCKLLMQGDVRIFLDRPGNIPLSPLIFILNRLSNSIIFFGVAFWAAQSPRPSADVAMYSSPQPRQDAHYMTSWSLLDCLSTVIPSSRANAFLERPETQDISSRDVAF